jgi:hypothetical protein
MVNNGQVIGVIKYLTKLTHTVDSFRFRFVNVEVNHVTRGTKSQPEIQYDLDITPKQSDIPYIWDFFSCKSKDIIEEGCGMVSLSFDEVFTNLNSIYYNGIKIKRYGGYIPKSFVEKVSNDIDQMGPKQIKSHFFCGGEKKELILNVTYKLSSMYPDDGIVTDVLVYCSQILVDNEPLENIPQSLAETIVGYISENDDLRIPLDDIVWDDITRYMDLQSCELWTHTYTYLTNLGDIKVEDYDYVGHSTFSSKMCDFITGDY